MSKPQVLAEPALVGREKELEELQSFLKMVVEGKGKTVFVSGEAGSGKTRLVTEFLIEARKRGITVLTGWCLSNAAVPYFPFFEAFSRFFTGDQYAEIDASESVPGVVGSPEFEPATATPDKLDVTTWLMGPSQAEKLGRPVGVPAQVWKDQTFIAVANTLNAISSRGPVILFLDDVHWADSSSMALIHYIARCIVLDKVLVIATYRSEALTVDSEGRPHPLTETLRLMRREDLFKEIKLTNLSESDLASLAKSMLGGALQQQFADRLEKESQGNSLFIVESLRMLHEQGGLVREDGRWHLVSDKVGIPAKIRDIILQRLTGLTRSQRKVLDAASVIGERFNAEHLASTVGLELAETLETLYAIAQATSLIYCEGELFKFDHARSRDAVYDEIPSALRKLYHAKVAESLEGRGGTLSFGDLAYHFAEAGNKEKAVRYAVAAGQDALARWSNVEAIKHFTFVLQSIGQNGEWAEDRATAMEGLGDAFYASSMFKQATTSFEDLSNSLNGAAKLRVLRKAMESAFQYMDVSHLMELVKKAEPYAAADRLENARVLISRARVYYFGQNATKLALGDQLTALRVFEEEYSLWDAALALMGAGPFLGMSGMPDKGIAESLRAIELFEELGDYRFQMEACWVAGAALNGSLLGKEALRMFAKVIEIDEKTKMGDYQRLTIANWYSSVAYVNLGDLEEALSHGLKTLELSKKTDNLAAPAMAYSILTYIYFRLGDLKHAEEYFRRLANLPPEILSNPFIQMELARAVFFAGKGLWEESNKCFNGLFERLKASPAPQVELSAKHAFAWALERQGRLEEAKTLLEEVHKTEREVEKRVAHVNLQVSLMVRREVAAGEEFEMRFDLVNVGRRPCRVANIEGVIPPGFNVVNILSGCSLHDGDLEIKEGGVGPFAVETVKLKLKATEPGKFNINPKVTWIDDSGDTKTLNVNLVTVMVQLAKPAFETLPGRLATGTVELDRLLYGGIPEGCAVVLVSPSFEERQKLIENYVEVGIKGGQTTFYFTNDPGKAASWAEENPSEMFLFVCSPKADLMVKDLPNVYKIKGVDNLTEVDIALAKAMRKFEAADAKPKRVCVEIVSDVLLQHHAVTTRKWLRGFVQELKSKGFTVLAVIDPFISSDEVPAIVSLFDGEIRMAERETANGVAKTLRIVKLQGQKYLKDEVTLG